MAAAHAALVTQGGDVHGRHHDALTGTGRGLGQEASVVVHHHAPSRPRVGRVVAQARALVGRDHEGRVLEGAAAVDDRPPVHGLGGTPGVHVGGDADQDLGAVGRELPQRLRKDPVVADGAADPADGRVGHGKEGLVVAGKVVRARLDLVGDPRVHLAVLVEDALGTDEAARVEHDPGPLGVHLEHRAALDVDPVLLGLRVEPVPCARSGSRRPGGAAAPRRSSTRAPHGRTPETPRGARAGREPIPRPRCRWWRGSGRCSSACRPA